MDANEWSRIRQGIFGGESGGDYNALFNYQNRPGGRFADTKLTDMTVNQALDFASPSGPYADYVRGQVGRVATPMGAYQIVGSTLRDASQGLGLTGDEKMTTGLQERLGQWIYQKQGTGAWEGYKPVTDAQAVGADAMAALGRQSNTGGQRMAMQPTQRQGILGALGIQKQDRNAQGDTALPFYQRDDFKDTMGKLAVGFNSLTLRPDQNLAANVRANRQERQTNQTRNKTVQYLRANGRADLASMVEQGMISGQDAAGQLLAKPSAGEIREVNGTLVRVMPDGSVTELYASERSDELTADMREYNLAREQGFSGNFIEFIQAQKGGGLRIITNPDGTTEIIQGGPSTPKLTEGQGKATGFYARSGEANQILSELEQEGTQLRNALAGALPFGNYMQTTQGQQYEQAQRNFVNAILRQESGAAIGPAEFDSAKLQYFPQPGDLPEVVAQKKANRETAVNALRIAAGEGAAVIDEVTTPVTPATPVTGTGLSVDDLQYLGLETDK